jgi:hypothetical protein
MSIPTLAAWRIVVENDVVVISAGGALSGAFIVFCLWGR